MFDNILYESASSLLSEDIKRGTLPGSILLAGPAASGKLSCALELARVLSCTGSVKGAWNCNCPSCQKHKALVSTNVMIAGPGDRTLEITAAKNTLLQENANNTSHLEAARFLYIRAVRKLTARFSFVLWEGEDKLAKFSPLLEAIDDCLEQINPGRTIPDTEELQTLLETIEKNAAKLEDSYLYDALPVSQIRNLSSWAHLAANEGKRIIIIENADCMADSARNALLKILEEPPADTQFILTTNRRGAMLPTILSRVRTYQFFDRTKEQQQEVIERVYHFHPHSDEEMPETIDAFLMRYLAVQPKVIEKQVNKFFTSIASGHMPDIPPIVKECANFDPRILYRLFIQSLISVQKDLKNTARGAEASTQFLEMTRNAYNSVTIYNQNPASSLEELARNLMLVNHQNNGVFGTLVSE